MYYAVQGLIDLTLTAIGCITARKDETGGRVCIGFSKSMADRLL